MKLYSLLLCASAILLGGGRAQGMAQLSETLKITARDGDANDRFGHAVALDGNLLVVGADRDSDVQLNAGSAYVFERTGTTWNQVAKLTPPGLSSRGFFGGAVYVDASTETIVCSAEVAFGQPVGAVYVFVRTGTTWVQQALLTAPDAESGDGFGIAALDGDYLAVGSGLDDDADPTSHSTNSGSAYVFVRSGSTWTHQAKLVPSDTSAGDIFGFSVSLDGPVLAVGARGDDVGNGPNQGSVYIFERSGTTWTETHKLTASDGTADHSFGYQVSLENGRLLVSALGLGYVYPFERIGASWVERQRFTGSGTIPGYNFGSRMSRAAGSVVVGALESNSNAGTAHLFRLASSGWVEVAELQRSDPSPSDSFGRCAVQGDWVFVGAPGDDDVAPEAGAVYAFRLGVPFSYCASKPASSGCTPYAAWEGTPSATDPAPFRVSGNHLLPSSASVLLYGFARSDLDFHGGKLCVKSPIVRLLPPKLSKATGPAPCPGFVQRDFNARIQSGTDPQLTSGQTVHAQWLQRDTLDPAGFGDSLTNGLRFVIRP